MRIPFTSKEIIVAILSFAAGGSGLAYYQEFVKPALAPVNVDVSLQLSRDKEAKDDKLTLAESFEDESAKKSIPVKLEVALQNLSKSKNVILYDPFYVAYGMNIVDNSYGDTSRPSLEKRDLSRTSSASTFRQSDEDIITYKPISYGRILGLTLLRPSQKIAEDRIINVRAGKYDFLQVRIYVYTSITNASPLDIQINSDDDDLYVDFVFDRETRLPKTAVCTMDGMLNIEGVPCKGNVLDPKDRRRRQYDVQENTVVREIWLDNFPLADNDKVSTSID